MSVNGNNEYKVVYTHGGIDTPIEDPLLIHINGYDYYMGRKETGPLIMVWPYQRGDDKVTKGGIFLPGSATESDAIQHRYGKVLEVGEAAWSDVICFPKPRCYLHDWIVYRRYEVQVWGHQVLLEKDHETGIVKMSDTSGPSIVVGKLLPEYVVHNYGPLLNPDYVDTNKHIGR